MTLDFRWFTPLCHMRVASRHVFRSALASSVSGFCGYGGRLAGRGGAGGSSAAGRPARAWPWSHSSSSTTSTSSLMRQAVSWRALIVAYTSGMSAERRRSTYCRFRDFTRSAS